MNAADRLIPATVADPNRSIRGQIVFADEQLGAPDYKVQVYTRNLFGFESLAGEFKTDNAGRFDFNYQWNPSFAQTDHRVSLVVMQKIRPFAKKGLFCAKEYVAAEKIERTVPIAQPHQDLRNIQVTFAQIPKGVTEVSEPEITHRQPFSWYFKFIRATWQETIKSLVVKIFGQFMSAAQVQRLYNSFGQSYPVRPLSGDALLGELLNEVQAVDYTQKGNEICWEANWDEYEFDIPNSLPNVTVRAEKGVDGKLDLKEIELKYREDDASTKVRPGDEKTPWAIYVARSVFALKGEGEMHLGLGHILPGIAAKPFFKYIRESNPLFQLCAPHLGQLQHINFLGSKGIIFGKGSVLEASALNERSVAELIVNALVKFADYTKFQTREPIEPDHHFARIQKDFYNRLFNYFKEYIKTHDQGIRENWEQVYNFSESVHKRFDKIPKITTSKEAPQPGDFERCAQFFAQMVNSTTFHHWAIHGRQGSVADLRSASLSMENRGLNAEGQLDPYGNTSVKAADSQNRIARTLMNWDGDKMVEDPYGNMDPGLLAMTREFVNIVETVVPFYRDIRNLTPVTQI